MEPQFTIETIHDLTLHKEFTKSYLQAGFFRNLLLLITCPFSLFLISQFDKPFFVYYYLILAAVCLVLNLIQNRKGGDIQYKRMLQLNNGEPVHHIYTLTPEGIHGTNPKNENKLDLGYDMFRSIIETPNLLILVMEHRSCLILEKRWLKGGTVEELTQFLLNSCPNLKRRKVKTTTFGKWARRIFILTVIVTAVFALASLSGVSLLDRMTGKLHNSMTYQEMADKLSTVGVTISDQTIAELEEYDREYASENGAEYYDQYSENVKIYDLLYWEGTGVYDEQTYEWTPSTSGIYWFDTEVWNVDTIYSDFFAGLSAMDPELRFTNVREDYSRADLEEGTGTVTVSFDYNGTQHMLEAAYYLDWFDTSFLFEVGQILQEDENSNDLYYANDGQGILLYYGSKDQVNSLERMTGIPFRITGSSFPFF